MYAMEQGTLFFASSGEYSDYSVIGVFRVLKTFDLAEKMAEFKGLETADDDDFRYDSHTAFVAWLNRNGFIADEPCSEQHLGSYGELRLGT